MSARADGAPDGTPAVSPPASTGNVPDQVVLCIEVKGKQWKPKKKKKFKVTAVFGGRKRFGKLKKKRYSRLKWWRKKGWDIVMVSGNIEHGFALFLQRYPDQKGR